MTKAHIVFTHTRSTDFIREVVHAAAHSLANAGWTVRSTDLACWLDVQADSRTTSQTANADEEFLSVADCDMLVLVFPVLWCSVPAALKQWIEMVFCDRLVAGKTPANSRGCMQGKKAIVVAVSEEAECIQRNDSIEATLADMLRPLLEGTLNYLGFEVLRPFFINGMGQMQANKNKELLFEVAAVFSQVKRRPSFYGLLRPAPGLSHLSMF
jgi:putative NADPH-quinone reductase